VILTKIYVGNLPWSSGEPELRELFSQFGDVQSVAIVTDRETGRSRGFGFVEMDDSSARDAIAKLHGRELNGRALTVSEAKAKSPDRGGRSDRPRW
jgi:RNA recognition motif-containing protein